MNDLQQLNNLFDQPGLAVPYQSAAELNARNLPGQHALEITLNPPTP